MSRLEIQNQHLPEQMLPLGHLLRVEGSQTGNLEEGPRAPFGGTGGLVSCQEETTLLSLEGA
jgi:hypothetical protein